MDISYTKAQLLDMGLTVIRNTRDFEKALGDWEALTARNKNWTIFKKHFSDAQKQLKAIRGPTMQQAGYHHAHMLAQQLKTDLERRDTEIFSIIQSVADSTSLLPSVAPTKVSTISASHQHVNATQTDPVQIEMLKILQQMQQTMLSGANVQQTTNT